jgi:hypothetical protein
MPPEPRFRPAARVTQVEAEQLASGPPDGSDDKGELTKAPDPGMLVHLAQAEAELLEALSKLQGGDGSPPGLRPAADMAANIHLVAGILNRLL